MSATSGGGETIEIRIAPGARDDDGIPLATTLALGGLAFAAAGALISLTVGLTIRGLLPRLSRRTFVASTGSSAPVLALLIIGLIGQASSGTFSLAFVFTMRWQGWVLMLAATLAGLLVASRLAPASPAKVDPTVFE